MCDVLFITPNGNNTILNESCGTLLLATILKKNGIKGKVINFSKLGDLKNIDNFFENAIAQILQLRPKIISFYTRCDVYHIDLRLAQIIKEKFNDVYIVFGGPQADITAEETIRTMSCVDYVCCGEGEKTIYPFFQSLLNGKPDLSVDGLVYRDGDIIHKNPRPQLIDDLDSLPMIDSEFLQDCEINLNENFPIDVGRGCPFGCTFCSTKSFWGRTFRLKSSQKIIEEIKFLNQNFRTTKFAFTHDMFTFNRKNVIEICKLFKKLDFPIEWSCSARLDCLDYELIDIMVESGMQKIYLGIETGSQRMQDLINKRLKIDNAVQVLEYLNGKNIKITSSFIYGFPEETEQDISQTLSLIHKLINLKNVVIQTHLCTFLPATELTQKYKLELLPAEQYSNITGNNAVDECNDLIKSNPELFEQFFEYPTDLRSKLKYFELFIKVWLYAKPLYNYIAELYGERNLFQMYCDFVDANKEFLEYDNEFTMVEKISRILINEKNISKFSDDANYDIMKDLIKLQRMAKSKEVKNGGTAIDVISFDTKCIEKYSSIREYPRGKYTIFCKNGKFVCIPQNNH